MYSMMYSHNKYTYIFSLHRLQTIPYYIILSYILFFLPTTYKILFFLCALIGFIYKPEIPEYTLFILLIHQIYLVQHKMQHTVIINNNFCLCSHSTFQISFFSILILYLHIFTFYFYNVICITGINHYVYCYPITVTL